MGSKTWQKSAVTCSLLLPCTWRSSGGGATWGDSVLCFEGLVKNVSLHPNHLVGQCRWFPGDWWGRARSAFTALTAPAGEWSWRCRELMSLWDELVGTLPWNLEQPGAGQQGTHLWGEEGTCPTGATCWVRAVNPSGTLADVRNAVDTWAVAGQAGCNELGRGLGAELC